MLSPALLAEGTCLSLLAQMTVQTTQQPSPAFSIIPILIGITIGLGISIVICLMLYKAQEAVPVEHRRIEPGMIWLSLIPLFNLFWNFKVFTKVPESYQSYFNSVGRTDVGDCGRQLGLWYAICAACAIIPCLGMFAGIASLGLLIMFLVKIYQLKGQLNQLGTGGFPLTPGSMPPPPPPPAM